VLDNIRETETTSTALPILPHGSLKTFALKAPSSTERLMMLVAGDTVFKLKKNGDGNSSKRPAAVSESENHRGEFCANSPAGQAAREQKVGKFIAELLY
jgi:hypothetical protein